MAEKDKKVTASEVAGELRKAARMFQVFEHAADAAQALAGLEGQERKLQVSINSLEKEAKQLDESCNDLADKAAKRKEDLAKVEAQIGAAEVEYKTLLGSAEAKARTEAHKIVDGAKEELLKLRKEIKDAKEVKYALGEDVQHAKHTLSDIMVKIQDVKANAMKALS